MISLALTLLISALPADLSTEVSAHDFTVVWFFSAECPVVRAHDARLIELSKQFPSVRFIAVDAQTTATPERAKSAAEKRAYPFPIVVDEKGLWADALGVRFSATVVVIDRSGRTRYFGGVDDQRVDTTSAEPKPYLRSALEKLLAGKDPEPATTRPLGCVLKRP
ncbi:MAG: redoxin family protein [Archangium sp.]